MVKPMKVKKYQPTLSLKPTQFALGLLEVEFKVVEMKAMKAKKLEKLVRESPVPVVVSPWKELCITNRHHFLFACWHAGVRRVRVEVVKDYSRSKLTYHGFWKKLAREKRAYLHDQFGEGPRSPLYLPIDIRGMADDPYRSLAWMVRKEGGFENSDLTFAEFHWADFFRAKRLLDILRIMCVAFRIAERPPYQHACPIADVTSNHRMRQLRLTQMQQHRIH